LTGLKDKIVQEILKEGRMYEVGGCVRDELLHRDLDPKDRDYLVCGIPIERLQNILSRHGRVDLVGRSFGVIKFTPHSEGAEPSPTFDISLPRRERSTGLLHTDFDVDFDPSLRVEDDLIRRDFSINAMARDVSDRHIVDPFGGQRDLEAGIIRMVSERSFEEDPLRMMRAVQFAARFEFAIEPDTVRALEANADQILSVSAERIAEELNKMLTRAAKPSIGLRLMHQTGLMKYILPEMEEAVGCEQPGGYHAYDVFEHTLRIVDEAPPRLRLRLAALFHDITKPRHKQLTEAGATFYGHEMSSARTARKIMKRLRYSTELIREVSFLVERHMFTTEMGSKGLRRFIRRVGQELIPDLLDLRRADVEAQGMGPSADPILPWMGAI
jgi:tRNA nucleotidyltransferase (CCA-adding enzyme)